MNFFKSLFSSILWTSFLMTLCVVLFLMLLIPVKSETPFWLLFRFMFYVFISSVGLLFLYDGTNRLNKSTEEESEIPEGLAEKLENPRNTVINEDIEVRPDFEQGLSETERILYKHFGEK